MSIGRQYVFVRLWPLLLIVLIVGAFIVERFLFIPALQPFRQGREMMDTWVSITVYAANEAYADASMDAALSRMEDVVAIASIHDPLAEAARLNSNGRLTAPSPELIEILLAAKTFFEVSRGVFDITVQPLLELWQYDPTADVQFWELESEVQRAAISEARELLGVDRISWTGSPDPVVELEPGMKITLGGIAKGYAVDQGLAELREAGIRHALIDAGGDIAVMGGKPGGAKWEIALRNPEDETEAVVTFEISDGAIATSGNYYRYFDPSAEVGHIMDPRTGFSAFESTSATVVATTCMEADALATAVFVLGPVEGLKMVNGLEAVEAMVLGYDDPIQIARSEHLDRYETRKKDGE
ncbi:MAG: FAD:protein FMN transferase [Candidatus Bipolaricaulota bacterium]